jgi:hypothetical protein
MILSRLKIYLDFQSLQESVAETRQKLINLAERSRRKDDSFLYFLFFFSQSSLVIPLLTNTISQKLANSLDFSKKTANNNKQYLFINLTLSLY